ncbi:mechanosensitive channel of smallconductance-like 10 [Striga asiatica]|uniref:Mechanosensitive channel of smallconductance-like 10 n=1 Tax=Striga asiatica TaxID=4170 RepID=A0A5A7PU82_STRAF|nr:mechanosensitive channel of smallconductance-like 10 [Striga asiatica]
MFQHVFRLFKEFEKFDDNVSQPRSRRREFDTLNDSSESDVPYDGQPTPESPGLSSFSPQQSDDGVGGTSSQRPMEAKKAKLKKKNEDQFCKYFNTLNAKSDSIVDLLQKAEECQSVQLQLQKQQLDLQKKRDEDRILMIDLNTLTNPMIRRHWEQRHAHFARKRI